MLPSASSVSTVKRTFGPNKTIGGLTVSNADPTTTKSDLREAQVTPTKEPTVNRTAPISKKKTPKPVAKKPAPAASADSGDSSDDESSDDAPARASNTKKRSRDNITSNGKKSKAPEKLQAAPVALNYSEQTLVPDTGFKYRSTASPNKAYKHQTGLVEAFSGAILETMQHRARNELTFLADHKAYLAHHLPPKTNVPKNIKTILSTNLICAPTKQQQAYVRSQNRAVLNKLAGIVYSNKMMSISIRVLDRSTGTIVHIDSPHLAEAFARPMRTIEQEILKSPNTTLAKNLRAESTSLQDWSFRHVEDTYLTMLEADNCKKISELFGDKADKPTTLPDCDELTAEDYAAALEAKDDVFSTIPAAVVMQEYTKMYMRSTFGHRAGGGGGNSHAIVSDEESEGLQPEAADADSDSDEDEAPPAKRTKLGN